MIFKCKQFDIQQEKSQMKVNTDAFLLGAWARVEGKKRILDVGTGTGIIALMAAQRADKDAIIDGVEIDEASFKEASENYEKSPWGNRMKCKHDSIQDYSRANNERYDLILSNPPFFSGGTFSTNQNKTNVKHTTRLSHSDLITACTRLLEPRGTLEIVLPYMEGERLIDYVEMHGLYESQVVEIRSKINLPIERLLISLSRENNAAPRKSLVLLDEGKERNYSTEYINLTSSYHTIF